MTVTGGPEHVEPMITIPEAPALRWLRMVRGWGGNVTDECRDLAAVIEAAGPPPPDIEWRAGLLVQRLDADGNGWGPVYMCRPPYGGMVRLETGEDHLERVYPSPAGGMVLLGAEWRVVQGRPLVEFTDPAR